MNIVDREKRTICSALWAAYGDALGFPTELASESIVHRRLGSRKSIATQPWYRLVGGKFGAEVRLPAGAYSDDTQLRLATSRAIRGDGTFDVESFAKIELPVWLTYALGAGRGSKAAAESLGNKKATWFSNFYSLDKGQYTSGGGNGAAMRVQPHVWAATHLDDKRKYLSDVIRNSVCTHGHARGIVGAMIHAVVLATVLDKGRVPRPEEWSEFAEVATLLPELVAQDGDLSTFWLPTWESESKKSIWHESHVVADEWRTAVNAALGCRRGTPVQNYVAIVDALNGRSTEERGSGLKCALFSMVAAYEFESDQIENAIQTIANTLNSDTDTIATMCGALLGALPGKNPPSDQLQDSPYLEQEASRLFNISQGLPVAHFGYPDLLYWTAPKALDAVAMYGNRLFLAGLGPLTGLDEPVEAVNKALAFQWYSLPFGQSVLCKRRRVPKKLLKSWLPTESLTQMRASSRAVPASGERPSAPDLFASDATVQGKTPSVDELTDEAIRAGFDPAVIGKHLLSFASSEQAVELSIAYCSIVVKAVRARSKKANGRL